MSMIRPRYSQSDQQAHLTRALVESLVAQALRNQTDWYYPGNPLGKGLQLTGAPMMPMMNAVVTTAITPCSTSFVPGTGMVQLYFNDTPGSGSSALTPDPAGSQPVQSWWQNSGTIATGLNCVVSWFTGSLWLWGWDCMPSSGSS